MDRENVIKGLEICWYHEQSCKDRACPYYLGEHELKIGSCERVLHLNALELLKKREEKTMIENERGWNCPSCGLKLIGKTASGYPCDLIDLPEDDPIHFCPMCGQSVKWE